MTLVDWSLLLALSILWGGSFFFVGVAVKHLPPFTIVLLRVVIAAAFEGRLDRVNDRFLPIKARWVVIGLMRCVDSMMITSPPISSAKSRLRRSASESRAISIFVPDESMDELKARIARSVAAANGDPAEDKAEHRGRSRA